MKAIVWKDEEAREALSSLREFASAREHHYRPMPGAATPGDDPRFVRKIPFTDNEGPNTLRVVFTISVDEHGRSWRHASFSARRGEPPPAFVMLMCGHLGFTGGLDDWVKKAEPEEGRMVVTVAQPSAKEDS